MRNSNEWFATSLLNVRVRNRAGYDLGKVEDLAIDLANGTLHYAIVSTNGPAGSAGKLYPIPWSALSVAPSRNTVILDIDKDSLDGAPAFERDEWPAIDDPTWQRSLSNYYGGAYRPAGVVTEPHAYVEPRPVSRRGVSLLGGIVLVCLILSLAWFGFLIMTRGWDQARSDINSTFQSAVYAAKETSRDAALTAKVKTALSLSKRIPSDKINVDSQGDVVTLRGEVPSEQVRDLAESIVRDVPGVSDVHNHIFAADHPQ
jgi:sporulation protein YlmC with PRC-barrel domain